MPRTESDLDNATPSPRDGEDAAQAGSGGQEPGAFRFPDPGDSGASSRRTGRGNSRRARPRATEMLVRQSGKQFRMVQAKSAEKIRQLAEGGKGRIDENLDTVIDLVDSGARAIDERYGPPYGKYARQAADLVSSFAGNIRSKSVEDLVEDSRAFVRHNPVATVVGATLAGFVMTRVIRAGLDDDEGASIPVAISGSTTYEGARS